MFVSLSGTEGSMLSGVTVDRDIVAPEEAFLVYEGSNTNTGSRRFKLTTVYKSRHDTTFTLFKRCVDAYK